jgi:hypothetical protein
MARTNFSYEKRQRELEKKKKAEEKARRKAEAKSHPDGAQEGAQAEENNGGDAQDASQETQNPA